MLGYSGGVNKDWEGRFRPSERKSWPRWLPWLIVLLIPITIGPWWFRIAMFVVLVSVILLGNGYKPGSK